MTENKQQQNIDEKRLLSDDEFISLMEAEFDSALTSENELEKRTIWKKLSNRLDFPKAKSWYQRKPAPWATAAMLLIVASPIVFLLQNSSIERTKGTSAPTTTLLYSYIMDNSGNLTQTNNYARVGQTIVFKTEQSNNTMLALLLSKDGHSPEVRFTNEASRSPRPQLLQRNDSVYGYMVEPLENRLKFCTISGKNKAQLKNNIEVAVSNWNNVNWHSINVQSCALIEVKR